MPKVYLAFDADADIPVVARTPEKVLKAAKQLPKAKNIRVLELSVDNYGSVMDKKVSALGNFALTERKRIQTELESLQTNRSDYLERQATRENELKAELAKLPQ